MITFLIPFAGGTSYSFKQYVKKSDELEFVLLDYPGKGQRARECFASTMEELVEDIYCKIVSYIRNHEVKEYLLWGHSMGGSIAYEVTLLLLKRKELVPSYVVISGTPPPSFDNRDELKTKIQSKSEFLTYLSSFGLISDIEMMKRPVFTKLIEASMNDYRILANYIPSKEVIENINGIVLYGKDDDSFVADWEDWRRFFGKNCMVSEYQGKHFFVFDSFPKIVEQIVSLCVK